MALYSRSGRPRPQRGGFELAVWYYMRLSGVALFVLALTHFSLQHFVSDPRSGCLWRLLRFSPSHG